MKTGFYRFVGLTDLFSWTKPAYNKLNWLFVVLDSNRDISKTEKYLSSKLKQQNISFEYRPEGLWLFGGEIANPFVSDGLAVSFSACYIFNMNTKSCPKPLFSVTTEQERSFADSEISAVITEMMRVNAIGYAADGGGLQWISLDDELSCLICQGIKELNSTSQP